MKQCADRRGVAGFAAILMVLFVLAPGLSLAGPGSALQSEPESLSAAIEPPGGTDDTVLDRTMRNLTRELGLTEQQRDRMKPLLEAHHADLRALRIEFKDWPEEAGRQAFREDMQEARSGFHDKLAAVLNADQLEKFKTLQANTRHRGRAAQEPE